MALVARARSCPRIGPVPEAHHVAQGGVRLGGGHGLGLGVVRLAEPLTWAAVLGQPSARPSKLPDGRGSHNLVKRPSATLRWGHAHALRGLSPVASTFLAHTRHRGHQPRGTSLWLCERPWLSQQLHRADHMKEVGESST
eukprot:scaffold626_cov409-Prasinococcus_capsulatus_cf.AAC.14